MTAMKPRLHTFLLAALLMPVVAVKVSAQGVPFLRNFTAQEYDAHNRTFDIITSKEGIVFAANFEGLLIYDKAEWQVLHTPGVQRLTTVFRDSHNRIWTGGYNYMGYVDIDRNGIYRLMQIGFKADEQLNGEVNWIWERHGEIQFLTSDQKIYHIKGNKAERLNDASVPEEGKSVYVNAKDVKQRQRLDFGLEALATGEGLVITDGRGNTICTIDEDNGLCSNSINHITYDGHGIIWGATDNGIFAVNVPSSYSRFTQSEGLKGEVLSIAYLGNRMFVGTLGGLFKQTGMRFTPVQQVKHACWQLTPSGNALLAATSNGVYRIGSDGNASQLSAYNTTAVLPDNGGYYSGELDGIYINANGGRQKISDMEKVTKLFNDNDGNLWAQNLYGQVNIRPSGRKAFIPIETEGSKGKDKIATLVIDRQRAYVVTESGIYEWNGTHMASAPKMKKAIPHYPLFSKTDEAGNIWLTDQEGKNLYTAKNGAISKDYDKWIKQLDEFTIRALHARDKQLWVGGDFGLVCMRFDYPDPNLNTKPRIHIRSIRLRNDSLLWGGGHDNLPERLPVLSDDDRNITFSYAIDYPSLQGAEYYRHRINGGEWSSWKDDQITRLINQSPGTYTFEVQAMDAAGNLSNIEKIAFSIAYPFFLRWYMFIIYALILAALIYALFKYRMKRLVKDKEKLERVVSERTAEIAQQKDEIEEKSNSLEKALSELSNAQKELVRQEKMATAGKLTQGLIDRILNPLNYINNFSKLSSSLINDVEANIEDEKEHMDADNYDDTKDVLGMLRQNLQKVEEHGMNTTRTLKAMEELLKDRSGGMEKMDLVEMLRKDFEMLNGYFHKDIDEHDIHTAIDVPSHPVHINGNAEQLSKSVMSILANGIYAVKKKKAAGVGFTPEVSIRLETSADMARIHLRDNGIGIEETILKKIFDPFFTTKTTGEAAGVGLYLSREIAQNHGGDITADSVKDQYSEFTITLPLTRDTNI